MIQIIRNVTRQDASNMVLAGTPIIKIDQEDIDLIFNDGQAHLISADEPLSENLQAVLTNMIAVLKQEFGDIHRISRILFHMTNTQKNPLTIQELDGINTLLSEFDDQVQIIWGLSEQDCPTRRFVLLFCSKWPE